MLEVREAAQQILRRASIAGHDFMGEMRALFDFVTNQVRYVKDPVGVETLQSPRYTLQTRMGDCDDKSILIVSLLRSIGHPAELAFRVIGTNASGRYTHVYPVARIGGRRIALDTTRAGTRFGWEYPAPTMAGEVLA